MPQTPDQLLDLASRMEAKPGGFRVSAETAPVVVEALRIYAREHCAEPLRDRGFGIDVWDQEGNQIIEHVAQTTNLAVARAAFAAIVAERPGQYVTVRQGIRVLMRSRED